MSSSKVLVVDDDAKLRYIIELNLQAAGYTVLAASDGVEALKLAREHQPDLVILDVMMPRLDGFAVGRTLREDPGFPDCSILYLTARDTLDDKGEGFAAGGDDYMVKPFAPRELLWRTEALLKRLRRPSLGGTSFACGALTLHPATVEVEREGRRTPLTPTEFALLQVLAETPGEVVPTEVLLKRVWGDDGAAWLATLRVHVNRVRQAIEPVPETPRFLRTVRGRGYTLTP